ncbi:lauroyl-Kdo(2)-lipid IV(A) myristoyltransferase [uncultured Ferrimonas sp.]|uniref:lauroyl-Kdo(2)-lipid IV(A) myristoyltransferase n=1 Tax=uncultured Ferrimonas sp. TaxID=432640 RepID=UPI002623B22E|nr:lauroyl-Kdo(2)-lipid IV(A) myristoyltransferase [uncultured Ferrimonas sp.]
MSAQPSDPHDPQLSWSMLHPRYVGLWLGLFTIWLLAFVPYQVRDKLALLIAKFMGRPGSSTRRRAEINLRLCFPDWSDAHREQVLRQMFARAAQVSLAYGILSVRSKSYLERHIKLHGIEHLQPHLDAGTPVILLAPHNWAIEFAGVLLASRGARWTAMMKPNPNPLMDWAMLLGRNRFKGKLFTRQHGIERLLNQIRQGYVAYYLPDQDHGMAKSEYVPFFATHKATLPGLGKMVEKTGAVVVPMYASYDPASGQFAGHIQAPMTSVPSGSPQGDARLLNQQLEAMISADPTQYMWILKLLDSRPEGEPSPYRRPKNTH